MICAPPKNFVIDLRVSESLVVHLPDGSAVVMTIEAKSGQIARVRVQADESIRIDRKEKMRTG
jgi:hypothetical protein